MDGPRDCHMVLRGTKSLTEQSQFSLLWVWVQRVMRANVIGPGAPGLPRNCSFAPCDLR